jgi:ubiquinone/menaquinone biosynthesis C-methylase UbiE
MKKRHFMAEDPGRRKWQDPDVILHSIGLRDGMVFIDTGCGEGFFAIPASRKVGPRGKVYAIDIDEAAVAVLREQAEREGLFNLYPIAAAAEDALPCRRCADIVFFGIDLHDFNDPLKVLGNAKEMLADSGRIVDLDWKDEPMDIGPPPEKRFSVEKARGMIESAGFRILAVEDAGPYHYLIIAGL